MGKQKGFLGIDPGKTGAMALLVSLEDELICDFTTAKAMADKLDEWSIEFTINLAVLEKVSAMPKQGVVSMFNFGMNYGVWQGILAAYRIPYQLLTPKQWQQNLITKSDGDDPKSRSLNVARRLFPNVDLSKKVHSGRADALLMAHKARIMAGERI